MLNDYYQNIGAKGFFARYGIINAIRRGSYIASGIHYVRDYEMKKLLWQRKVAKKVEKYFKYYNQTPEGLVLKNVTLRNPVWVYWNTGMENAPDIVKSCYFSMRKYEGDRIVPLSDNNLDQYIQMPEYIEKKKNQGLMPLACYTDLVRFALLEHYGGTWIDATVYLTDCIPDLILKSDFFAFRNTLGLLENPALYAVWFLHAKKNNEVIKKVRNVSFAYWKNENHVVEYLLSNIIITKILAKDLDAEQAIPYMNSDYSEYFVRVLGNQFDEEQWQWIKKLTSIHKLTYKLSTEIDRENTFYHKLVRRLIG